MLERKRLLDLIGIKLAHLKACVETLNKIHFFDLNVVAEDFFADLLNAVYGFSLVNLNHQNLNAAAVDLGDTTRRIAVQVTSERAKAKIQKTLNAFSKHGLANDYDSLKILIIGDRTGDYPTLDVPEGITFSAKDDVIDIGQLLKDIAQLPVETLKTIADLIEREVRDTSSAGESEDFKSGLLDQIGANQQELLKQLAEHRQQTSLLSEALNQVQGTVTAISATVLPDALSSAPPVEEELDRIRESQNAQLDTQAEQPAELKAYLGAQFDLIQRQVASISTANISALVAPQHEGSLKYARQLIEANKPAQAIAFLETQRVGLWSTASEAIKAQFLNCMGAAHLRLMREREAANLFFEAKQHDDQDEKILCNCAVAHLLLGDALAALKAAQQVLDRNPASMRARSVMIHASVEKPFEEIIESVPLDCLDNHEVTFALGSAAQERRNRVEAEKWFRVTVEKEPTPSPDSRGSLATAVLARLFQGETSLLHIGPPSIAQAKALQEVVSLLDDALRQFQEPEIRRTRFFYLVNRGIARQILGDKSEAAKDIDEALAFEPDLPTALFHRAIIADSLGDTAAAIKLLGRIKDIEDVPFAPLLRADYILEQDGPDAAIAAVASFLAIAKSDELTQSAKRLLISAYLQKQDFATAQKLSDELVEANPTDVVDLVEAAGVQRRQGFTDNADALLEKARSRVTEATRPTHIAVLADAFYLLGRFSEAASLYDRVADTAIDSPLTRRFLLACYRAGKNGRAIEIADSLNTTNGPLEFATEVAVAVFEEIGDLGRAREACNIYLARIPDDAVMRIRRAVVDLRSDNTDAVDAFLSNPPSIKTLPVECAIQVANLLAARDRHNEAIKLLYEVRRAHPTGQVHLRYVHAFLFHGSDSHEWLSISEAARDVAVCVESVGRTIWYVLEDRADANVAAGELPITHDLAKEFLGKRLGDTVLLKRGMLSAEEATIIEIKSKYVYALHESAEALQTRFLDVQGFEAVHVPAGEAGAQAGFQKVLDGISKQHAGQEELLRLYDSNQLTIGALGSFLGQDSFKAWSLLVHRKRPLLRCCIGIPEERHSALSILQSAGRTLVIDPISLITIHNLGLADAIVQVTGQLGVAQSTADLLNNELHRRKASGRDGFLTIGKEGGQFVRHEVTRDDVERHIEWLEALKEWVGRNCETLAWPLSFQMERQQREKLEEVLGEESLDTVLVATGEGRFLYSDDVHLRGIASGVFGVTGTWTQPILMKGIDDKVIDRAAYNRAILTLVCCGYKHTSIDSQAVVEAARQAHWQPGTPFVQVVRTLEGHECDENSAVQVAAQVIRGLFGRGIEQIAHKRLVFRLLDSLVTNRQIGSVVGKLSAWFKVRAIFPLIAERLLLDLVRQWWLERFG
jgi:tetratricopeptide (TPR) repeat protein